MPDAEGFPNSGEIVNWKTKPLEAPAPALELPEGMVLALITRHMAATIQHIPLTETQAKSVSLVMMGLPYVLVAMQPIIGSEGIATSCNFHTTLDGDKDTIRDAAPHLDGVVQRLLHKNGIF